MTPLFFTAVGVLLAIAALVIAKIYDYAERVRLLTWLLMRAGLLSCAVAILWQIAKFCESHKETGL